MKNLAKSMAVAGLSVGSSANMAFGGWPYQTGDIIFGSPAIADINGDGTLEIVFGDWDGKVHCVDIAGNSLWVTPLCLPPFDPDIKSSPTLADLDGNSKTLETVIGSSACSLNFNGRLYCLDSEGNLLGSFDTPRGIRSSPLVTDLESDGELEILFGDLRPDGGPPASLYCVRVIPDGKGGIELVERWSVSYLDGSVFEAPAVPLGNGVLEIFVSLGGTNGTSSPNASMFCLDINGKEIWSWFEQVGGSFHYNTPALSDIDGDGELDVAVAPFHGEMYCLDAFDGSIKWMYNHPGASLLDSPAVADVQNNDGLLEVLIGSYAGGTSGDRAYCIDHEGGLLWDHILGPGWMSHSSPAVGDIDGDGDLEIAMGTLGSPPPTSAPARMYIFDHEGNIVANPVIPGQIECSPAMADLDGDGTLEILFGSSDHKFYVLNHQGHIFTPNPNTKPKDLKPWPTYRQNNQRTGYYPGPPKTPDVIGDVTNDGVVNVDDVIAVINSWGFCPAPPKKCPADLAPVPPKKPDGEVNVDDLLLVVNNWS